METIYSGQIINQGTIEEDAAAASVALTSNVLTINGDWVNTGTIEAGNGTTLDLYGNWSNDGTITVAAMCTANLGSPVNISPANSSAAGYDWSNQGTLSIGNGATVNLGGVFTVDTFESFIANLAAIGESLAADTVSLTGTLDNSGLDNPASGGVLALDAATGTLNLAGGQIYQGVITTSGSDDLAGTDGSTQITAGGTLDGVTLDGVLEGGWAKVMDGLTLNGTIGSTTLDFGQGPATGVPADNTPQEVVGSGTIEGSQESLVNYSNDMLTIGPGITIVGGLNTSIEPAYYPYYPTPGFYDYFDYYYGGPITNDGTIEENPAGGR